MIKMVSLLVRKDGMTHEQFMKHWVEVHGPLALKVPGLRRYVQSHIAEEPMTMKPFTDTEGAHGEGTPVQAAKSIAFRVSQPGYVLSWHCAPRRQYSIALAGLAEIEVGDGTVARVEPGDIVLAEDLTGRGHVTRVVGDQPRYYAIVPLE